MKSWLEPKIRAFFCSRTRNLTSEAHFSPKSKKKKFSSKNTKLKLIISNENNLEELPDKIQRNDTKFEYLKEDRLFLNITTKEKNKKSKMNEMKNTTKMWKYSLTVKKKFWTNIK